MGDGKHRSIERGFILCGRRRKQLDAPRYRRVRRSQKASDDEPKGAVSGLGQTSGRRGVTLTIVAGRILCSKIIRRIMMERNILNSEPAMAESMIGMQSICTGHTNQFIGGESFLNHCVSGHSAFCGA